MWKYAKKHSWLVAQASVRIGVYLQDYILNFIIWFLLSGSEYSNNVIQNDEDGFNLSFSDKASFWKKFPPNMGGLHNSAVSLICQDRFVVLSSLLATVNWNIRLIF